MNVVILAAGYATRLYPYTKNFPKPLLKIHSKPIIEYLIDKLNNVKGISKIIVVTNARFFSAFEKWSKKIRSRYPIEICNDKTMNPEERLGAVGDMKLAFAENGFDKDYLIIGGDNFFDEPLNDFVNFAQKKENAVSIGVFDIKDLKEAVRFGVVKTNKDGRVIGFQEKPKKPRSTFIAMCLYYLPQKSLKFVKKYLDDQRNSHDASGSYIRWLALKHKVYAFTFQHKWFDIGTIQTYKRVKQLNKGAV